MVFTNFNPPFTNKELKDFFSFESYNTSAALFMREWLLSEFPDLMEIKKYHVPFYTIDKNPVCYLHYFELDGDHPYELELSFPKGSLIEDAEGLFQAKNSKTKAIHITCTDTEFLRKVGVYVENSCKLFG